MFGEAINYLATQFVSHQPSIPWADHASDSITQAAQLVSALAVVKRASRHFAKPPNMQSLTQVVTLELASAARRFLLSAGSILGQDPGPLLDRLHTARQLIKAWMVRSACCQTVCTA